MLATGIVGAVEDPWIRWSWISGHADVIIAALLQHIQLTLIAVVVGLLIAVPLGLLAWRRRVLPLAFPGILAGVRIATVTTIGLVTVTALIGEGGLGSLIYDGLLRDFKTPLVVGTVLCVALAVLSDLGLAGLQRVVTPWARSRAVP